MGDGPAAFTAAAPHYDESRARYPEALIAWALEGYTSPDVADVGAGTGIASRALAAAGARVLAVEPNPSMRAAFAAGTPSLALCSGRAEALPLHDACVDIVTFFECFHWCDAPRALGEARRVLRANGRVVVAWSELGDDPQGAGEAVAALFRAGAAEGTHANRPAEAGSSDVLRNVGAALLEELHLESRERFGRARLYGLFRSLSYAPRDPAAAERIYNDFWRTREPDAIVTLTYRFDAFRLPVRALRGL